MEYFNILYNYSINNILFFLFAYSFIGWSIESIYVTLKNKKLTNSGFLYGPFCPIYGIGSVLLLIFLRPFANNLIIVFVLSFFIASVWEYIAGFIMEIIFGLKWWDYSKCPLNINGRICLIYSFFWGFLGIALIKWVHPLIKELLIIMPPLVITVFVILFISYYVIDSVFSSMKALKLKELLNKKHKSLLDYVNKRVVKNK